VADLPHITQMRPAVCQRQLSFLSSEQLSIRWPSRKKTVNR